MDRPFISIAKVLYDRLHELDRGQTPDDCIFEALYQAGYDGLYRVCDCGNMIECNGCCIGDCNDCEHSEYCAKDKKLYYDGCFALKKFSGLCDGAECAPGLLKKLEKSEHDDLDGILESHKLYITER